MPPSADVNTKNSYNFKNFALSGISIRLDGNTQPIRPLKANYASRQCVQAHMSLPSGTGKENRDEGNDIMREVTRCTSLTAARISPKKNTLTWPSKEPFASNSNLKRHHRTLCCDRRRLRRV